MTYVGGKSAAEGEPESAEGVEDDAGEGVSEDELADTTKDEEQAPKEIIIRRGGCEVACPAARTSPAHELDGGGRGTHQEAGEGYRGWVGKGSPKLASDGVLGVEVELLIASGGFAVDFGSVDSLNLVGRR